MNRPVQHGPDALSLQDTAAECGISWERFRKVWPRWARDLGFPQPFKGPTKVGNSTVREAYAWRASAVANWKLAREAALGAAGVAPRPLNDNPRPGPTGGARLERDRAALREMIRSNQA